ncbi:hypothetical protein [Actinoplanes couchii]|uniref:hypothetical protein n=1 Tax=Actinoplanes couchii TaxID=403638 RepID=UPI001EF2BBA5|nr:hypothetical protein [Actinoplanes couchii]MDR6322262.1 hypothetical protein [Actinoplanes couchii]
MANGGTASTAVVAAASSSARPVTPTWAQATAVNTDAATSSRMPPRVNRTFCTVIVLSFGSVCCPETGA